MDSCDSFRNCAVLTRRDQVVAPNPDEIIDHPPEREEVNAGAVAVNGVEIPAKQGWNSVVAGDFLGVAHHPACPGVPFGRRGDVAGDAGCGAKVLADSLPNLMTGSNPTDPPRRRVLDYFTVKQS